VFSVYAALAWSSIVAFDFALSAGIANASFARLAFAAQDLVDVRRFVISGLVIRLVLVPRGLHVMGIADRAWL
jgi:hypothetical protein